MKKRIFLRLCVPFVVSLCSVGMLAQQVKGSLVEVTSVDVVNAAGVVTTLANGVTSGGADYAFDTAILQTLTDANGQVYTAIEGGTFTGIGTPEVLYGVGSSVPTVATALGDLDLATGTLNNIQNGDPDDHFVFSTPITSTTTFAVFSNGTPITSVALVDSSGTNISNTVNIASAEETELSDFTFVRGSGAANLQNREVSGDIFGVNDFTLDAGESVANVVGFRFVSGNSSDAQDVLLIQAVSVPEPNSVFLIGVVASGLFVRRRK